MDAMTTFEKIGFSLYLAGTVIFFLWVALLTFRK
jgi:hypothetical protein